jgi:hypothetical protein
MIFQTQGHSKKTQRQFSLRTLLVTVAIIALVIYSFLTNGLGILF